MRNPQRLTAYLAMGRLADHMVERRQNRPLDPVYADLRTSMDDWRIALALSVGAPLDEIDRDGYWRPARKSMRLEMAA